MIKVYQIALTDQEVDEINNNRSRLEPNNRLAAFRDRSFESTFKNYNFRFYDHVAKSDVVLNISSQNSCTYCETSL